MLRELTCGVMPMFAGLFISVPPLSSLGYSRTPFANTRLGPGTENGDKSFPTHSDPKTRGYQSGVPGPPGVRENINNINKNFRKACNSFNKVISNLNSSFSTTGTIFIIR